MFSAPSELRCVIFEPCHEEICFLHRQKQRRIAGRLPAHLISAFVFTTQIIQSLYFINPKFQVSSHLLRLYSQVCDGLVGNPKDRISRVMAYFDRILSLIPFIISAYSKERLLHVMTTIIS